MANLHSKTPSRIINNLLHGKLCNTAVFLLVKFIFSRLRGSKKIKLTRKNTQPYYTTFHVFNNLYILIVKILRFINPAFLFSAFFVSIQCDASQSDDPGGNSSVLFVCLFVCCFRLFPGCTDSSDSFHVFFNCTPRKSSSKILSGNSFQPKLLLMENVALLFVWVRVVRVVFRKTVVGD